jgi:crotonobetaine/carnitine-CoA ligase
MFRRVKPTAELRYVASTDNATTIPQVLRSRAEMTPDARFITFEDTTVTYAGAMRRAERASAAFASLGVQRGDTVAVMLPNCLEFLDLWFGCALIGAALVPVNLGLRGDGLRYIVEHSDANVAVVDASVREIFDQAVPAGVGPQQRFVRAGQDPELDTLAELLAGNHPIPRYPTVKPEHIASILYTSGTTGRPKGVLNCQNSYAVAALEFTSRYVRTRADDVFYTSLPLFHVNAQMLTTMGSMVSGRPMVLAPRFSASGFMDDVRDHGATVFNYIGAMLTMIAKQPERQSDVASPARLAVGGAAPVELWTGFERRFSLTILEIYGLTETACFCLGSPPDDIRPGTIGVPVGWSEVRVIADTGQEAALGQPGEIAIKSKRPDVLFKGYYKDPAATAASIADGWFHSGDRGVRGADGYISFIDRLKDVIRRRGENISSFEIEQIVNTYPLVAASAAVGVPSDLGEDDVMVHVIAQDGAVFPPADLIAFCEERMAQFMVPRYVRLRDTFPKTATERVQKFVLRDEGTAGAWDRDARIV